MRITRLQVLNKIDVTKKDAGSKVLQISYLSFANNKINGCFLLIIVGATISTIEMSGRLNVFNKM